MTTSEWHDHETRALHWLELIIDDSFAVEMNETAFAACCQNLIYHLEPHIDIAASKARRKAAEGVAS